tara:strand:- start:61 stop:231 length:171 start_codon:yes stop_codon:yes gene_type:complete
MKENLKEQLESLEKHLKWCIDNNKPQEHLDVHNRVISNIKQEIELLNQNKDENRSL